MEAFDTARLRLRPLAGGDESLYRRIYTDPRVMRHVAPPLSADEARASFAIACRHNAAACGREWWVCVERAGGRSIGIVGTTRRDLGDREAEDRGVEIGVVLLARWQRMGFAAEAIAALIGRIAPKEPAIAVRLRHASDNVGMRQLARSLGFRMEADDGTEARWRWCGDGRGSQIRGA